MLVTENNENYPILNQIYDIIAELNNQGKQNTLCKVPAHIGKKGNEEADNAAKEAIYMPGMIKTRLLFDHWARNSKWQREWENNTSKLH